jgi:hypothetical protein
VTEIAPAIPGLDAHPRDDTDCADEMQPLT